MYPEALVIDAADAAAALLREHDDRAPFRSIRGTFPFEEIGVSYAIQDEVVRRLLERNGCGAAGYKIGLTSPRMQQMCGIPHPIGGRVLANRVHPSGTTVPLSAFIHLGIECEIAVRMGRDLTPGALPATVEEIGRAVEAVAPAFELVEDRHADYASLDMLTLVADNSWNAGVVLGEFRPAWPELGSIEGVLTVNGQALDRGFGRDVMGHPFEPLLWLARHLAERGEALRAGEIVMTGSLVPTRFPSAGDRYRFALAGLGDVEVALTA